MADKDKASSQPQGTKKTPDGGGKKKNKHKKSLDPSGDGAPSPSSSEQGSMSSIPQAQGATPDVKQSGKGAKGEGTPKQKENVKLQDGATSTPKQSQKNQEKGQKPKTEGGKKPEGGEGEQKSKAQLKAERRAIQEAQRQAKEAKKNEAGASGASGGGGGAAVAAKKEAVGEKSKGGGEAANAEKKVKKKVSSKTIVRDETEEQMWARKEKEMLGKSLKIDNSILNLGFQYFHHRIVGANARCVALLATLKEVITKYRTPDEKELSRDLEKNFLNPCISYINYCRPLSTSMGNAIKHLKYHISQIPRDMEDEVAIARLQEVIDNFIQVNITKAAEAVAHYALTKIDDDDVILIYAASSLIGQVLKTAHAQGKRFRVIVVEGRPRTEGKSMLKYLVRCGIPCSYIYIGSASHAMSETTKVFLGAAAMFAIGDMHSRTGNSMIAALAKANNVPVLVCCETYKFTDKVQLHSGDSNLHARGKDLISIGHKQPILGNWEELGLRLLNVMYDVTGSKYITALVTELGMLPCTSVPVVLRRQEDLVNEG